MIAAGNLTTVFLDLDDTLCDTEGLTPMRLAAVRELLDGEVAADLLDSVLGEAASWDPLADEESGRVNRVQRMKEALGLSDDQLRPVRARYNEVLFENLTLVDGARETLAWLRERVKVGLITNGPSELQRTKIERLGIGGAFDSITVSGEVGFHKPARELFEAALRSLDAGADVAVYAGDRPEFDIRGARNVGMTCALIRTDYPFPLPAAPQADFVLTNVTELPRLIRECGWLPS